MKRGKFVRQFGWLLCLLSGFIRSEPFQCPPFERQVLPNGMVLILMEQHEVPLVSVSAVVKTGSVHDGEKHGLAFLTGQGLLLGTKNRCKIEIEESLDFIGAEYQVSVYKEETALSVSFMKTDEDLVLSLIADILMRPSFPADEFEKRKSRHLDELTNNKESPSRVIRAYFDQFMFGNHPYGNPVSGTEPDVGRITTDDVRAFYSKQYGPGNTVMAVAGDFKTDRIAKKIRHLFGEWKASGGPADAVPADIAEPEKPRVLFVNKSDAVETRFMIGGPGIPRNNPDYTGIQVINTILGGRFTSWLNDEMRINRGLTYGVRSYFSCFIRSGAFIISSFTPNATTEEALDVALEVYGRLHDQGPDEATLASARNYMSGQFPPRFETSEDLANLLTEMEVYGFDASFINDFQKQVSEIDTARAKKLIETYFPEDNFQIVVIGKGSEIRPLLDKYGSVTEKEITAHGF
ncbi:insulinase family protein [bacterium]|nr:insulinase family protein [bacterium]